MTIQAPSSWSDTMQGVSDTAMRVAGDHANLSLGFGTLLLINAGIAQGKNRSGLNWFLISLLLGPLATFILVAFCDKLPSANN